MASVLGAIMTINGCCILAGTPLIVAIMEASGDGSFAGAITFTAVINVAATVMALYLRLLKARRVFCVV